MVQPILPARASVRPRVKSLLSMQPCLLEDEIATLLAAGKRQEVYLLGGPGVGRSTALAHLAAAFVGDQRLALIDRDRSSGPADALITVRADGEFTAPKPQLFLLQPWSDDEVLEYLLAKHGNCIARVFEAWRAAPSHDLGSWPGLCRRVLDTMAAEPGLPDVMTALSRLAQEEFGAGYAAISAQALHHFVIPTVPASLADNAATNRAAEPRLLQSNLVEGLLAAQQLLDLALQQRRSPSLRLHWRPALRHALAHVLRRDPELSNRLTALAANRRLRQQALVFSSLCAHRPAFRPTSTLHGELRHAWLRGIDLRGHYVRAKLCNSVLRAADLRDCHFDRCDLTTVDLRRAKAAKLRCTDLTGIELRAAAIDAPESSWRTAQLRRADFQRSRLDDADFTGACLDHARMTGSSLRNGNLSHASLGYTTLADADLRGAICRDTHFEQVDLRSVRLDGARFAMAWFVRCTLAGINTPDLVSPGARFRDCDLTGTRWHGANLAGASFAGCGLADVDWQGADLRWADLRRANFHLGNSRSGLVDSTVASEGSRTGFYTDESLEQGFQAPEDVRKANLRDCDLRGARLDDTDFYLVDLRGAQLDAEQRAWLRRCRAILDPE